MSEDTKKQEEANQKEKFPEMKTVVSNNMVITVDGTEGRKFTFSMPFNTPLKECYDAAVNAANEIARLFSEAVEKQKEEALKKAEKEADSKEAK